MKKLATVLLILLPANFVFAQTKPEKLRVGTRLVKPFVYEEGGILTGFSVELWHELSRQLKVNSDFVVKASVKELLQAVKSKEVHLGISAVSITAEREIDFDFSQPMFDAGLQILTPAQGSTGGLIGAIVAGIFSPSVLPIIGVVLLMILVPAHLVWFFERRNATGLLTHRSYFPGILEACWWAASTLATQADQMPRTALARITAVICMFASVVFIAYFTAAVTSSLTVQQLRGEINGPADLPGKRIASVKGSTSADYLQRRHMKSWNMPTSKRRIARSVRAKQTQWFMTLRYSSTTHRATAREKSKSSALFFARKTMASFFLPKVRTASRLTKRCSKSKKMVPTIAFTRNGSVVMDHDDSSSEFQVTR